MYAYYIIIIIIIIFYYYYYYWLIEWLLQYICTCSESWHGLEQLHELGCDINKLHWGYMYSLMILLKP